MSASVHRERELFEQALDLPAAAREAFVSEACGADTELARRVRELLGAELAAGRFLGAQTPSDSVHGKGPSVAELIGRYCLGERLGEGGFGEVYRAEQTEPVRRQVALKILKPGMGSRQVVTRFETERQVLALMDHPNIARVFDAGATAEGRPYFVMELVPGVPLTRHCDEQRLPVRERLALFTEVCDALQHAHQKGIIHRDLKPSNVLVAVQDERAVPKVIDFGVAKATQPEAAGPGLTRAFELLGTPAYMSPEQTRFSGRDVDIRTDLYSLGVILYELLVGRTPFDEQELRDAGLDVWRRRICEEDPPRPSVRWRSLPSAEQSEVAARRRTTPAALERQLRGDLDWIVMRCLAKDRERRYSSAAALAADLRRHLEDEPVEAAAPSVSYRLGKFLRRHRLAVTAAAVVAFIMITATAVSFMLAWRATNAERTTYHLLETEQQQRQLLEKLRHRADEEALRARTEAATAQAVTQFLNEDLLGWADPAREPEREITLRSVLDRASRRLSGSLTNEPAVAAAIHETLGRAYVNLALWGMAARHYEVARDLFTQTRGATAEATLNAAIEAAFARHRAGDSTNALPVIEAVTATARTQLSRSHPLAIHCGARLAWLYYNLRRLGDWEREAEETYADLQGVEGVADTDLLGVIYLVAAKRGRLRGGVFEDGEEILLHASRLMQERHGPDHALTMRTKTLLGVYYFDHGRKLEEAESLLLAVLDWQRRTLGELHEHTLITLGNLALLYRRSHQIGAAERMYLQLLSLRPNHAGDLLNLHELIAIAPLPSAASSADPLMWRATTTEPGDLWTAATFDDSTWARAAEPPGDTEAGWWRATFELPVPPSEPLVVSVKGVGHGQVHVNGIPAGPEFRSVSRKGHFLVTSPDATRALRAGRNVVAVRVFQTEASEPFRLGLHRFPPAEPRPTPAP
jgi:serine/threonine protein kinase